MKKTITFLTGILLSVIIFAQAPESFTYQAIVRNSSGQPLPNTSVTFQFNILQTSTSGTTVYSEEQTATTNGFGLVNLQIGQGTVQSGTFSAINWSSDAYFLNIKLDLGSGFVDLGTQQFISVPYALYAKSAGSGGTTYTAGNGISITGNVIENTAPDQTVTIASGGATSVSGTYPNFTVSSTDNVDDADADPTNELQALSISNDTIFLNNGGFVKLPAGFNGQYSSLTGAPTNVSYFTNDAGYLTSEVDGSVTNELQALSISNDTIFLSNGGFVKIPATNWLLTGNAGTDGTNFIGTIDSVDLMMKTYNIERLRITCNGNVGISNSTPSEKLDITGNIKSSGTIYSGAFGSIISSSSGNNTYVKAGQAGGGLGASLQFSGGNLNGGNLSLEAGGANHFAKGGDVVIKAGDAFDTGSQGGSIFLKTGGYNNTGSSGYIAFYTGGNYPANLSNPPERMRIDGFGNIGIGTTNPDTKLQVYGVSGNLLKLQTSNIMNTAGQAIGITFVTSANDEVSRIEAITESSGNIGMRLFTYQGVSGGANERLRIASDGNVGIGTTTPTEKLEVNGNLKVHGNIYAPGTVVQTIVKTSEDTSFLNVTTFTEPDTSYRISITPKYANSIILVEYSFSINTFMSSHNTIFHMQLIRDIGGSETPVGVGPAHGNRDQTTYVSRPNNGYDTNDLQNVYMVAKDEGLTPGTKYTYGFKFRRETAGNGTCYFNYSYGDSSVYGFSGIMTMKITEIAQ